MSKKARKTKHFVFVVTALCLLAVFSGCQKKVIRVQTQNELPQEVQKPVKEKAIDSIKIGVITDIHRCEARSPGKITAERLRNFVDDVNAKGVDFNVDLGDNIRYRMNNCHDDASEELTWVIENLKTEAPLHHVLSDHDVDDVKSFDFWKKATGTEKSFYSFDVKNFHIMVLDTVSGDGELDEVCLGDAKCQNAKNEYEKRRDLLKNEVQLKEYLEQNGKSKETLEKEKVEFEEKLKTIRATGKELALIEKRDKGSILQNQLDWIESDLDQTEKEKVIIFSDHPLFSYEGKRKLYEIVNLEKLQLALKDSNKQIISISGETHEWHEEVIEGIQYYLIGQFSLSEIGSWAVFEWAGDEKRLEKIEK